MPRSVKAAPDVSFCRKRREVTEVDKAILSLKTQRRKLSAERTRVLAQTYETHMNRTPREPYDYPSDSPDSSLISGTHPARGVLVELSAAPMGCSGALWLCLQVEGLITREIQLAREFIAAKRRERALLHMRKKKLHEQNVDKIDSYLLNVEQVGI